jgi:aspartokinase
MARITDALLTVAAAAEKGGHAAARQLDEHFDRHLAVAEHLGADTRGELTAAIEGARREVTLLLEEIAAEVAVVPRSQDLVVSYGEQLSARLRPKPSPNRTRSRRSPVTPLSSRLICHHRRPSPIIK